MINWYPFAFVAPNGKVFMAGAPYFKTNAWPDPQTPSDPTVHRDTYYLDTALERWQLVARADNPGGSAVMYRHDKVMKAGSGWWGCYTGNDATDGYSTAFTIDLSAGTPSWTSIASMNDPRREFYLIVLPDGKVMAVGGRDPVPYNPKLSPEWYDPELGGNWTTLAPMTYRREYHSSAVLLPDGRIMVGGGQYGATQATCNSETGTYWSGNTCYQRTIQIFKPPYLFTAGDQSIDDVGVRPTITSAPSAFSYGRGYDIYTPQASQVTRVSMIRLGAATHAFDQNQRYIELDYTIPASDRIRVSSPANVNVAPMGYYMLFITINGDRASIEYPSRAKMVKMQMLTLP